MGSISVKIKKSFEDMFVESDIRKRVEVIIYKLVELNVIGDKNPNTLLIKVQGDVYEGIKEVLYWIGDLEDEDEDKDDGIPFIAYSIESLQYMLNILEARRW